jgi:hypothetical protein
MSMRKPMELTLFVINAPHSNSRLSGSRSHVGRGPTIDVWALNDANESTSNIETSPRNRRWWNLWLATVAVDYLTSYFLLCYFQPDAKNVGHSPSIDGGNFYSHEKSSSSNGISKKEAIKRIINFLQNPPTMSENTWPRRRFLDGRGSWWKISAHSLDLKWFKNPEDIGGDIDISKELWWWKTTRMTVENPLVRWGYGPHKNFSDGRRLTNLLPQWSSSQVSLKDLCNFG